MSKKVILILIVLITILLFVPSLFQGKEYNYKDLVISNADFDEIIATRQLSTVEMANEIIFNNNSLFYDNNIDRNFYYSIVENDYFKYNPKVKINGINENIKVSFTNELNEDVVKTNTTIKLIVYDDTYYAVYFLKATTLPLMKISYDKDVELSKEEKEDMKLALFDNREDATSRLITSDGDIHLRGALSLFYPKQGYKISLENKSVGNHNRNNNISLLGMRQDDDWILYAAYNDQEKVRNVFAMNLWYESCADNNEFGFKNGMEYKYIELILNDEYYGLYALGYPIDEKQTNLDKKDEVMFKKKQYNHTEVEMNNSDKLELDDYQIINSQKNEEDAWNELRAYYDVLLNSNNTEEIYNIADINSSIDYWLFLLFTQGNDNGNDMYLKNIIFSIKNQNGKKKVVMTPWDFDLSFGNIYEAEMLGGTNEYGVDVSHNVIFNLNQVGALQKLGDSKINELIKKRYKTLRTKYWTEEHINELIDDYEKQIFDSGAFNRDINTWLACNHVSEDTRLSKFREFVLKRLEYTDKYIEELK